jgi:hypothetical protein
MAAEAVIVYDIHRLAANAAGFHRFSIFINNQSTKKGLCHDL